MKFNRQKEPKKYSDDYYIFVLIGILFICIIIMILKADYSDYPKHSDYKKTFNYK